MEPKEIALESHSAVPTANHCGCAGSLNDLFQIAGRQPKAIHTSCEFKLMSASKRLDSGFESLPISSLPFAKRSE
jgi:hypothetical protein